MGFTISHVSLPVFITPAAPMDDEALLRFCAENNALHVERTSRGELRVMSPSGSGTGAKNAEIIFQLTSWSRDGGGGVVFDSSAGFSLPDGSMLSPDAAWIAMPRWLALTEVERERFAPVCPDFVIELRSPSDRLAELQAKMLQWIENGAKLAWLVDPQSRSVAVYRPGAEPRVAEAPATIAADDPVEGFVLDSARLWGKHQACSA